MRFSVYQLSRKGGREKNEDRMGYCYTNSSGLFLLADGMGGKSGGRKAADQVMHTARQLFDRFVPAKDDPAEILRQLRALGRADAVGDGREVQQILHSLPEQAAPACAACRALDGAALWPGALGDRRGHRAHDLQESLGADADGAGRQAQDACRTIDAPVSRHLRASAVVDSARKGHGHRREARPVRRLRPAPALVRGLLLPSLPLAAALAWATRWSTSSSPRLTAWTP